VWRLELRADRDGTQKPTKVPYNPRTGQRASSTDPHTWASYSEALSTYHGSAQLDGIGYVLSPDDPYVGVDLDKCRDRDSGAIQTWARQIVDRLNSYTEISPSQTGLRIFIRGTLPPHGRRKGPLEIYSQARFLTITGNRLPGTPDAIYDRSDELSVWHEEVFGPVVQQRPTALVQRSPLALSDSELIERARNAANGTAFWALWNGDWSGQYHSQSEADLALVNHLSFWTGPDPARLDSLFRSSGLMRDKWERADYRDSTIGKALEGKTEFYSGPGAGLHLVIPGGSVAAPSYTVDPATGEVVEESPWRTLGEVVRAAPDHGRQLAEGMLWEMRTHWVYSGPGAGKTLFWLAALMHIADSSKDTFCGRKLVHGPVLLIEEDSPDSVISDYVEMLADIYDIDVDTIPFLTNRVKGIRLMDDAGVAQVQAMVAKAPWQPLVLGLDACERLVPSEKFSSKELEPLSRLLQWTLTMKMSNIVIDHTRKPTGTMQPVDPIDTLYGGRTKSAISDVMIHLSGTIRDQAFMTFPKFRGEEQTPISIHFDGSEGFSLKTGKPKLTDSESSVMRVINNSFGKPLSKHDICELAHIKDKTAQRALSRLVALGWVERSGSTSDARFSAASGAPGIFG